MKRSTLLLACLAATTSAACARTPSGLRLSDAWIRVIAPGLPAAGYFTLSNQTDRPAQLTGASSPACGSLSLHRTVEAGGTSAMPGMAAMSTMQPVAAVTIPAHGSVRFAPGGTHLMCERTTPAVRPGASITVTLRLDNGRTITSDVPVRGARGH